MSVQHTDPTKQTHDKVARKHPTWKLGPRVPFFCSTHARAQFQTEFLHHTGGCARVRSIIAPERNGDHGYLAPAQKCTLIHKCTITACRTLTRRARQQTCARMLPHTQAPLPEPRPWLPRLSATSTCARLRQPSTVSGTVTTDSVLLNSELHMCAQSRAHKHRTQNCDHRFLASGTHTHECCSAVTPKSQKNRKLTCDHGLL